MVVADQVVLATDGAPVAETDVRLSDWLPSAGSGKQLEERLIKYWTDMNPRTMSGSIALESFFVLHDGETSAEYPKDSVAWRHLLDEIDAPGFPACAFFLETCSKLVLNVKSHL